MKYTQQQLEAIAKHFSWFDVSQDQDGNLIASHHESGWPRPLLVTDEQKAEIARLLGRQEIMPR